MPMNNEEKPKPLINQQTIDWLNRAVPKLEYKPGMTTLEQVAYTAGQQDIISRLERELRRKPKKRV